jgi:hypothetical protein
MSLDTHSKLWSWTSHKDVKLMQIVGFVSPFAREDALDDAEHAQAVWNALNDIASSSGETSTSRKQGDWASDDDEDPDESSNFEYG